MVFRSFLSSLLEERGRRRLRGSEYQPRTFPKCRSHSSAEQLESRCLLTSINLGALATDGIELFGTDDFDQSGWSVSYVGDMNGDGFDEVIIGAPEADGAGNALLSAGQSYIVYGSASPTSMQLATAGGVVPIYGADIEDWSGRTVNAAGDINGDGYSDAIIVAAGGDAGGNGKSESGDAYIILGGASLPASIDLAAPGSTAITIFGVDILDGGNLQVGSAGDVNGDGLDDLIVGASWADGATNSNEYSGDSYLIFGDTSLSGTLDLAAPGVVDVVLYGGESFDESGRAVSGVGDFNGDGFDDLVIGAPGADAAANAKPDAGESYLIFGEASLPSAIDLSVAGSVDVTVFGADAGDRSGGSVSGAGDVNGDGYADVIIGAALSGGLGNGFLGAGESYVLFGTAASSPTIDLNSLGAVGTTIYGTDAGDNSGYSVKNAGDVNADGYDDVIIGADRANGNANGVDRAGESYVLFGSPTLSSSVALATLAGNGVTIFGADAEDHSGRSVSSAGDVNGDGFDDVIIGAPLGDGAGNTVDSAGGSYVVFGSDFSTAVTHPGTAAAEILTGDVDILRGNGGADVLLGGEGDDQLVVTDLLFRRLIGGNGADQLRLDGTGMDLDLTSIADSRIQGFAEIDITGSGDNSLTLNHREVLNLNDESNTLIVRRNLGDSVDVGTGWTTQANETIGGDVFEVYVQGQAILKIQALPGSISGLVWDDVNKNAIPDGTESGLAGRLVFVDSNGNGALDGSEVSAVTDAAGLYTLVDIAVGQYSIATLHPGGWVQTLPAVVAHAVTVESEAAVSDVDFGSHEVQPGLITGVKWSDDNGDGIYDATESPLAGVTIYIDVNDNGSLDTGETTSLTDAAGVYAFTGLPMGDYTIREVVGDLFEQTFPRSQSASLFAYSASSNQIISIDPLTGTAIAQFNTPVTEAGGPDFGMATTADSILVGGIASEPIYEMDAVTGATIRTIANPGLSISGMAIVGNELFLTDDTSTDLTVLDLTTGAVLRTVSTNVSESLGSDGTRLLGGRRGAQVFEVNRFTGAMTVLHTLVGTGSIEGLGVVGEELFVADGPVIRGYDLATGVFLRQLNVSGDYEAIGADGVGSGNGAHFVTLEADSDLFGLNFGNQSILPAEIIGTKWNDLNQNGVRDAGEPGLASWVIYLDTNANNQLDSGESFSVTDANGDYSFSTLAAGDYRVNEVRQDGWLQTFPTIGHWDVTVGQGELLTGIDFGDHELLPGSISGVAWSDLSNDGVKDTGEPGASGWVVYLDENRNGQLDAGESVVVTDAGGNYSFVDIPPGEHTVRLIQQNGWDQTFPASDFWVISVGSGQNVVDVDFGNHEVQPGSISGVAWNDLSNDGVKDAGESGASGWVIYLDTDANGQLDGGEPTAITDASGGYSFSGLEPGDYTIREVQQGGWDQTYPVADHWFVTVMSGQDVVDRDFGNHEIMPGSISGQLWNDLSNDGVKDSGESGVQGWVVYLDTNTNGQLDGGEPVAVSDASGHYSFANLSPGNYTVNEVQQTGWAQTFPAQGEWTITLASGQNIVDTDFGNHEILPGTISGSKWNDLNADGVRDAGEGPLADVLIYLDANGNREFDASEVSTLTDAAGLYQFSGVLPGSYSVREVVPVGFEQTHPLSDNHGLFAYSATGQIISIDPMTGSEITRFASPVGSASGPDFGLATTASSVWAGGVSTQPIYEVDPVSGAVLRTITNPGINVSGMAILGGELYLSSDNNGAITVMDLATGSVLRTLLANVREGLGTDGTRLLALSSSSAMVEIDRFTGAATPVYSLSATGAAEGLGVVAGELFVSDSSAIDVYDLATGTYLRSLTISGNFEAIGADPSSSGSGGHLIDVASGVTITDIDFGNHQIVPAQIEGTVWSDLNQDGIRDSGEPVVPGWTVFLDDNSDGVLNAGEVSMVTDAAGHYHFGGLEAGTYRVAQVVAANWAATSPVSGFVSLTVAQGDVVSGTDFGNHQILPASISGTKWNDVDGNGVFDSGEMALAGITIYLDTNENMLLDAGELSTLTDASGNYTFTDLQPGGYTVREVLPAGFEQTFPLPEELELLISESNGGMVRRYDLNGAFQGTFTIGGGLDSPGVTGLDFGPDGHLYVANAAANSVMRYNGQTGAFIDTFATGGGLSSAQGLAFGPDGNLYVSGYLTDAVLRYDGTTGVFMDVFASSASLDGPLGMEFSAGGLLYVTSYNNGQVLSFDATTGVFVDAFVTGGATRGYSDVEIGPDGRVYVLNAGDNTVQRFELDGTLVDVFVARGGLNRPWDMEFAQDGTLYVVSAGKSQVFRFDGTTGALIDVVASSLATPTAILLTGNNDGAHTVIIQSGDDITGLDFGNREILNGSITGHVFYDLDQSGSRESGEPGVQNWTVFLDDNSNGLVDAGEPSVLTDASGYYSFADVPRGPHLVSLTVTSGWLATAPALGAQTIDVGNGDDVTDVLFGVHEIQPGEVHGSIWSDLNNDGVRDTGEGALAGWIVYLDLDNDGAIDGGEPLSITDGNGDYSFTGLAAGDHTIAVLSQAGWTQTMPASGARQITIGNSEVLSNLDFGFHQLQPGSISGVLWNDLNQDGLQDAGEPLLSGWSVFLDTNTNGVLDTAEVSVLTDGVGAYSFPDLLPGSYVVAQVLLNGWIQTAPATGSHAVTLSSGLDPAGIDFGNHEIQTGSISGVLWNDLNRDGLQDAGEPLQPDWTIFLDTNTNGVFDAGEVSVLTDASGAYSFADLLPGSYVVAQVLQAGWVQTAPVTGTWTVTISSGEDLTGINFGNHQITPSTISGTKWRDQNANGLRDTGELPLAGVVIYLDINDSGTLDTGDVSTITDAAGFYEFVDVAIGRYVVREVIPTGFEQTYPLPEPSEMLVSNWSGNQVLRYGLDGSYIGVAASGGELSGPNIDGLTIGPDQNLYVASSSTNSVLRFDLRTGAFIDVFASGGGLSWTRGVQFGPDGHLYVSSDSTDEVLRYNGTTGVFIDSFASGGGLNSPVGIEFSADGFLYVTSRNTDAVLRYDATTGVFVDNFISGGGLDAPQDVKFGPDGHVYVSSYSSNQVLRYDGATGTFIDVFTSGTSLNSPSGLNFGADGHLYVTSFSSDNVLRFDGMTGVFIDVAASGSGLNGASTVIFSGDTTGAHRIDLGYSESQADVDFGNQEIIPATASGQLWSDLNQDGILDTGEPGLSGWTVFVDRNQNGVEDAGELTVTTDAGGAYTFGAVDKGAHNIAVTVPAGWVMTSPANGHSNIVVDHGEVVASVDFGIHENQPGRISGIVFSDLNQDGTHETGEPVAAGWTVFLDSNDDGILNAGEASVVSDASGQYSFTLLPPDTYNVSVVGQSGWTQTFPAAGGQTVVIGSGVTFAGLDFGQHELQAGTIRGTKWNDADADGVFDAGESVLANVTIYLDLNNNHQMDAGEPSVLTDGTGQYEFTDVTPGAYVVREVVPSSFVQTFPAFGSSGSVVLYNDPLTVDTLDESVNLQASFASVGVPLTTFTGSTEAAFFGALSAAGTLVIPEQERRGLGTFLDAATLAVIRTFVQNGGGLIINGELNSRASDFVNTLTGFSLSETRLPDGSTTTRNAAATGTAFADAGASLVSNNLSMGLTISSLPSQAAVIYGDATTAAVATLSFGRGEIVYLGWDWWGGAPQGAADNGWVDLLDRAVAASGANDGHPVTLGSGEDLTNLNFGNHELLPASISGTTWEDVNQNGTIDGTEIPLQGITVFIDENRNGTLDAEESFAITDNTGSYHFSGLRPGITNVRQVPASRFTATIPASELHVIDVVEGEDRGNVDFGNLRLMGFDFGDSPAAYPTTLAEAGARHVAVGPTLGATRTVTIDGVHSDYADNGELDEDGVTFGVVQQGAGTAMVTVDVSRSSGRLDAWLDFNADGDWEDPGEQILTSVDVTVGANLLTFAVPSGSIAGTTFARFRISTVGGLTFAGAAIDGEVEDHAVAIVPAVPVDLSAHSFNAVSDHVLGAQTEVEFRVQNTGSSPTAGFVTHVVWSPNNIIGDADDRVVPGTTQTFTGLAAGAVSPERTVNVKLDQAALYALATAATPTGQPVGTVSVESSHLFLVVDANDDVSEIDETNNSGIGHLVDSDDVVYFPWDKNSNGVVEPIEALTSLQAIGTTDAASDFDGNGIVSPLEALSAIQRIGYVRADVLSKATPVGKATLSFAASTPALHADSGRIQPSVTEESVSQPATVYTIVPALAYVADEERASLFETESDDSYASVHLVTDDSPEIGSEPFTSTEWLDVI